MGAISLNAGPSQGRQIPAAASAAPAKYKIDVLRWSLAIIIVLDVSRIHQHYGFIGALRPALLLSALAVAAAVLNPRALAAPEWMGRWPAKVIAAIGVVALGSIAFGISQGGSFWFFVANYSKVLVGAFLLMAAIRNARDLWVFVWAYVIGSAVLVWMALFVFDLQTEANGFARLSNLETWDANDIGVLLLIGLAFCIMLFRVSQKKGKIAVSGILLGIGAAIARSGSRGAFLGFGVVMMAYLFSLKGTSMLRRIALVGIIVVGVIVAAPKGYWNQMNTITSVEDDYNWNEAQGRRQLAIHGMQYMMSYPIFGLGLGNFGRAEGTLSERAKAWSGGEAGIKWSAPHNSYVEAGSEMGVPGLLLFTTLVIGCIVAPWKLRKRIPAEWERGTWDQQLMFQMAVYLPLAVLGFAVTSFFVSFAYHDPIYILAAMVTGLRACVEAELRKDPRHRRPQGPRGLRAVRARGGAAAFRAPVPVPMHVPGQVPVQTMTVASPPIHGGAPAPFQRPPST